MDGKSSPSHVHTFKAETSIRVDAVTDIAVQCVQAGVPDQRCATVVQLYTRTFVHNSVHNSSYNLPSVCVLTHFAALYCQTKGYSRRFTPR